MAWLTFQSTALRPMNIKRDGLHLLAPIFTIFCLLFAPLTLDTVLALIFLGYGSAIIIRLHQDDALPIARLESGPLPTRIWKAVGGFLIFAAGAPA